MPEKIKFIEDQLKALVKQISDTSVLMERAKSATLGDIATLTATCRAESVVIFTNSLEQWCSRYQRAINAVNTLENALRAAIDRLVKSELDAQSYAHQG